MHVLVIPSWYRTPKFPMAGIFFRQQAMDLVTLGHTVGVLFARQTSITRPANFRKSEVVTNNGVEEVFFNVFDFKWFNHALHYQLILKEVLKAYKKYEERRGRPDIILAHSVNMGGWIAQQLKIEHGLKYVLYEHSSDVAEGKEKMDSSIFNFSDRVVAVSTFLKDKIRQLYAHSIPIDVIPLGLSSSFRNKVSWTGSKKMHKIVMVGSLVPIKQYEKAIAAIMLLDDNRIELDIIGDGMERESIASMIKNNGLANRVKLLGRKRPEEIKDIFSRSDFILSTSKVETLGVALIEGLSCGLIAITTPSGGPIDTVDESNGIISKTDEPKDIAQAIARAISKRSSYNRLEIQEKCIEKYGNYSTKKLVEILEEIVN